QPKSRCQAIEVAIGMTIPISAIEIMRARLTPAAFHRGTSMAATFAGEEAVAGGWLDELVEADQVLARAQEVATEAASVRTEGDQGRNRGTPNGIHPRLMPRAKQRTPELRDRLLEVAIATLSEEGIARFTTRRVAERAGTSVPAVYELFDDKAGLVRAMFFEG